MSFTCQFESDAGDADAVKMNGNRENSENSENSEPSKQTRKRGPSDEQKKSLVDFLEHNLWVARNQFQSEDGTGDLKSKWDEVTKMLNMKGGAHKNPAEWKKCWVDLKTSVKKRYFGLKARMVQSGNNGSVVDELDELDQRIVGIITIEALEGDGSREHGISATVRSAQRSSVLSDITDIEFLPGPSNAPETVVSGTSHTSSSQHSPAGSAPQLRQPTRPAANPTKRNKENEEMVLFKEMLEIKRRKLEILEADNLRKIEDDKIKREAHEVKLELMRAQVQVLKKQI